MLGKVEDGTRPDAALAPVLASNHRLLHLLLEATVLDVGDSSRLALWTRVVIYWILYTFPTKACPAAACVYWAREELLAEAAYELGNNDIFLFFTTRSHGCNGQLFINRTALIYTHISVMNVIIFFPPFHSRF